MTLSCIRSGWVVAGLGIVLGLPLLATAQEAPSSTARGDRLLADYFAAETARLRDASLADIQTIDHWTSRAPETRRQLLDMLGLDPLPERTELHATVTGRVDHPEFTVENLHYQSRPGLYVTGNLYVPKNLTKPAPAILYVCGHAKVVKDGVSYGGKAHYQHHGAWFARNGYVCLVIDTLQLGEIEGIHHGTYREHRWWWLSRGYCPAGVEAWNCIRALDYLQSRSEVDPQQLGVTGRSGGGAYSWWISAIDERIQAAVPVAGITDLQNHVVDGCVEGHCDCMYMVNTYRWDYAQVAALNYPRPLLISNTDRDGIFPLDGVYRTYSAVRRLYELGRHPDDVALNITAGGHVDTQELQIHALRWFDKHLRGEVRLIENAAQKLFEPEQLKVFQELPADQLNTRIDETFVPQASPPAVPTSAAEWATQREAWLTALQEKTFAGWPTEELPLSLEQMSTADNGGLTLTTYDFSSQPHVPLTLYVLHKTGLTKADVVVLNLLDQPGWEDFVTTMAPKFPAAFAETFPANNQRVGFWHLHQMLPTFPGAMAFLAPRGVGPTRWSPEAKKHIQNRRRFYLLGQTWEGMQTWDIRRGMQATRSLEAFRKVPLQLSAEGQTAALTLYAALFEPPVAGLNLHKLPLSHAAEGPALLNVLRTLDIPQVLAMTAERSPVQLSAPLNPFGDDPKVPQFAAETAKSLQWPEGRLPMVVAVPENPVRWNPAGSDQ